MIVYLISGAFPPEPNVSAQTGSQVASQLSKEGHSLLVITSYPSRPFGRIFPGYSRRLFSTEKGQDGVSILRCFSFFSPKSTLISRFLENVSFGLTSGLALFFSPRPDVLYMNTWPIFACGITRLIAGLKHIPLITHIKDLYPESLASQGRIKEGGLLYRMLMQIDGWIARGCTTVIVISPYFARRYAEFRRVNPEKIHVIYDWVDPSSVIPVLKTIYRKEKGIPSDAFVIGYGGNIGVAAGIDAVIRALDSIQLEEDIYFLIAGSGSRLESCQRLACNLMNKHVHMVFQSPWLTEDTSKLLCAADILFLPTLGKQSLASAPSKLITYLLASRPILALALPESSVSETIMQVGCGWIVAPDDPSLVIEKIRELVNVPGEELNHRGAAGRAYAMKHFVSDVCLRQVLQVVYDAGNSKSGIPHPT